jgi:hypothetical protein
MARDGQNESGIDRRQILRSWGAGGSILIGGEFGISSVLAEDNSGKRRAKKKNKIAGKNAKRLASSKFSANDIQNEMPTQLREAEKTTFVPAKQSEDGGEISNSQTERIHVAAARHTLEDETKMLALAYVTDENQVILYKEYESTAENGVKTAAYLYEMEGGEKLQNVRATSVDVSINGSRPKKRSELSSDENCDVCTGPGTYEEVIPHTCESWDMNCAVINCADCSAVCGPGLPNPPCIACVVVLCAAATFFTCCDSWNDEPTCVLCGMA